MNRVMSILAIYVFTYYLFLELCNKMGKIDTCDNDFFSFVKFSLIIFTILFILLAGTIYLTIRFMNPLFLLCSGAIFILTIIILQLIRKGVIK